MLTSRRGRIDNACMGNDKDINDVGPLVYNRLGKAYAKANETGVYNALYERPSSLALLPEVSGAKVLDLGCGPGAYSEILIALGAEVTAVDGSEAMLDIARERIGMAARFFRANFENGLPFEREEFDVIVTALTIHYVRDLDRLAKELFGLLKPWGKVVLSTEHPGLSYGNPPQDDYFACLPKTELWKFEGKEHPVTVYRRPLSGMLQPFLKAGFVLEQITEGILTDELRSSHPDYHALFRKAPPFLFFRWGKP